MNATMEYNTGNSSEATRTKLIDAGLRLFARLGFDGVRTRILAEEAGVNQAAIPYHFGGKDGVYAAVIEEIAKEIAGGLAQTGLLVSRPDDIAKMSRAECAVRLQALTKAFTTLILAPGRPIERTALIVREQLQPTATFATLFNHFIEPLHTTLSMLVARLDGSSSNKKAIIQAHALVGQTLAFVVAQRAYLLRSQQESISKEDAEDIAEILSIMAVRATCCASEDELKK